ncbi:MAG: hypothetical protein Q4F95_09545 [Oscillospiraceae bacterium]|nr:hypothetical protein [Oscillospiraceae bacterium]
MKKFKFFVIILTVLSLIMSIYNVIDGVRKRDWFVTTATIDRIGLPDGAVFGTYKDQKGIVHSEELFLGTFLQGYKIESRKYIGEKVKIIYEPQTGKILNYYKIIFYRWISGILLVVSVLLIIFINKKRDGK